MDGMTSLYKKLEEFRRRYYLNKLIKGLFYGLGLTLLVFISVSLLEYFGRFGSNARLILLIVSGISIAYLLAAYLIYPSLQYVKLGRQISNQQMAIIIGTFFKNVDDKIVNVLELENIDDGDNTLLLAAINQKVNELNRISFVRAIDLKSNKRLWPWLVLPVLVFVVLLSFEGGKEILSSSTRVINYSEAYIPPAPFQFVILNDSLKVNKGESVTLKLKLVGDRLPSEVILIKGAEEFRMTKSANYEFSSTIEQLKESISFRFKSGDYNSRTYKLEVVPVPAYTSLNIEVSPPGYTGLMPVIYPYKNKVSVPEGSNVRFKLGLRDVEKAIFNFENDSRLFREGELSLKPKKSLEYDIELENGYRKVVAVKEGRLDLIYDEKPHIEARFNRDSIYGSLVIYNVEFRDDYGISKLEKIIEVGEKKHVQMVKFGSNNIGGVEDLSKYENFSGDDIRMYFRVWDNDGINGAKSAKSEEYNLEVLNTEERYSLDTENIKSLLNNSESFKERTRALDKDISEVLNELRNKRDLDWKNKERLEKIIDDLEKIQSENKRRKEELEKLNRDVLKDSTGTKKELLEDLSKEDKKLNDLKKEISELMKKLDKDRLERKLKELQKENKKSLRKEERLEQSLEDLERQRDLLRAMDDLDKLSEKMDELSKRSNEDLKEMKEAKEEFDKITDKLDEIAKDDVIMDEMQKEDEFKKSKDNAESEMQKAMEEMENSSSGDENESQEKAGEEMKKMSQQLQKSLMNMEMAALMMNIESLKQILENLEIYSLGVEGLGSELSGLDANDPSYRDKLIDLNKLLLGSKVIEDSLIALSEKAPEIKEIVFEETDNMNYNLTIAKDKLQNQEFGESANHNQFAMMAANNLALLLDKSMQSMMQMLGNMMKGDKNCNKPGGSKPKPGDAGKKMSEMGQKIESLKKGNKPGEGEGGLSGQEMVQIMKEQEELRKMLNEELGENGNTGLMKEINRELDEVERDILNGELNDNFKERYKRIETRLLESEKAEMKRKEDEKRESNTADEINQNYERALEKYIREQSSQRENLILSPLKLQKFYYNQYTIDQR